MTETLRPKVRLTIAEVQEVRHISPSFKRLRLRGDFTAFAGNGLHFRFLFGPPELPWPTPTVEGLDWPGPDGAKAWHRPAYTIRALDPDGAWLDTDIFLHDGGRITEWTDTLQGGEPVGLTGPGGGGTFNARWQALIGDETALPVILRMIEALPTEARGQAEICVPDARDAQPVTLPPGFRLHWRVGQRPLERLQHLTFPASDRFIFFASEKAEAETARTWMTAHGIDKGESRSAAYWTSAPLLREESP